MAGSIMSSNPPTRDALDGYLTGKARVTWRGAQVWIIDGQYVLRRPGEPDVQLGAGENAASRFDDARRALAYLREDAHD